ncbi:MAG: hypothetical protein AAB481_00455 [Patescibacteria group bacterium]|mgnify:CR=1 FL=1
MRLILDKILWGALIVLFGPTVMIVASWNALPGDNLYGMKLALEKTALAIASPSYATTGSLQIKYTERRFAEAKQLMASKQSIQGLPYLDQQIAQTKKSIERAPNKEAQVALAKQYINALTTVSTDLEVQKQSITQQVATPTLNPTPTPPAEQDLASPDTPRPTVPQIPATGTRGVPTPIPTPTATPHPTPPAKQDLASPDTPIQIAQVSTTAPISTQQAVAALQIDQTQQNVSQTIADLQTLVDNDDREEKGNRREQKEDKGRKEDNDKKKNDEDKR